MMHHVHAFRRHPEVRNHLLAGELANGDHRRCPRCGIARLLGEAGAEVRRGVFRGHHEQVVEGGHRAGQRQRRQALIQAVEQLRAAQAQRSGQQAAPRVGRQALAPRAEIAVGTVAEPEAHFGVGGGHAEKDLAGIHPHSGQSIPQAIGGVQRNGQARRYAFILR